MCVARQTRRLSTVPRGVRVPIHPLERSYSVLFVEGTGRVLLLERWHSHSRGNAAKGGEKRSSVIRPGDDGVDF